MNRQETQVNPLYFEPPLFGEFLWALYSGMVGTTNATGRLHDHLTDPSYLSVLKRPFKLPSSIVPSRKVLDAFLLSIKEPETNYLGELGKYEGAEKLEKMFELMGPKATLEREHGYCSSISIFAVTLLRKLNKPARFNTQKEKPDHPLPIDDFVTEVFEEGWRKYTPESAGWRAAASINPEYDRCYEEFLELIHSKNKKIMRLIGAGERAQTKINHF